MKKRTQEEMEFDLGVKGWAFSSPDMLKRALPHYEELFAAIQNPNEERISTMKSIREIAAK